MLILSILIATIFFLLSTIHFYWAMGGVWGMAVAVPTKSKGEKMISPSVMACVVVAVGLLLMSLLQLRNILSFLSVIDVRVFRYGNFVIAFIFLARAIGDFKYAGFFKKVIDTPFAKNDSKVYSPLCLFLSISTSWLALYF
jgi:Protein of unknown function (DUF3995)